MTSHARHIGALVALAITVGCRPAEQPSGVAPTPAQAESPRVDAAPPADPSASKSPQLNELARSLGLGGIGASVPEGLVAGGDCPPPTGDTTAEIAAQASAVVPLKVGLTLSYLWTRTPQEEYECLIQVTKIEQAFIETSLSCNYPERGGPFIRRICRADLRHARMLHTLYGAIKVLGPAGDEEPETITGATAFSLSSDEFARMKRTGTMAQHYVEFGPSGRLEKNGVGELRVDGREVMRVIVNNQPAEVPVIKATGRLKWWIRGQELETDDVAMILDDERLPLFIDQKSSNETTGSRIQFTKITYPSEGSGPIEAGLLEEKRVDVYGLYFDFNSDRIRKESEPVLQEIGSIMKKHPDWRVGIAGHTDNVGGDGDYNTQLSRRRSEAVRNALVSRFGIGADRLTASGYGASAPKDTNDTPEGRARNRRVELVRQ